jgi:hypothetical protein
MRYSDLRHEPEVGTGFIDGLLRIHAKTGIANEAGTFPEILSRLVA